MHREKLPAQPADTVLIVQDIVRLLQTADALDADTIPLELQNFDFVPYLLSALPIAGPIMGVQLLHEIGHRVAASMRQVRLCTLLAVLHIAALASQAVAACSATSVSWACSCESCAVPHKQPAHASASVHLASQALAAVVYQALLTAAGGCRSSWACRSSCPTARSGCTAR